MEKDIYDLTHAIVRDLHNTNLRQKWHKLVIASDTETLMSVTAMLTSDEFKTDANIKALREAIIVEVDRKNTIAIIETMKKLDQSANRLSSISVWIAVIGAILAAIQVLQAFNFFGS